MASRGTALTLWPDTLHRLSAVELRDRIAQGDLAAADLAHACLDRTRAVEGQVHAWAWLDEAHVLAEAERLDAWRRAGRLLGPLHGLPIGIKDIIDTAGIPTENGTPLDKGRVPAEDATVVRRLKAAGAYVFGKTVTAELAFLHPGPTANPHDPSHTPGGSSQGSAAAVAAGMVPLAIGTQTGGSVIRPASFCGVVGFKPSFGLIPRDGILSQSPSLDTVGVFAATPADAALLTQALAGEEPGDPLTSPKPPPLLATTLSDPPGRPMLALLPRLPGAELHEDMVLAMEELAQVLGGGAFTIDLPPAFDKAAELREIINLVEMATHYDIYEHRGGNSLSSVLRNAMAKGWAIRSGDFRAVLSSSRVLGAALEEIQTRCDAILCPASLGPAPVGLNSTGSAICNGLWTLCGVPALSLPVFHSIDGLPMGLQLIGRREEDELLLRTASWLWSQLMKPNGFRSAPVSLV